MPKYDVKNQVVIVVWDSKSSSSYYSFLAAVDVRVEEDAGVCSDHGNLAIISGDSPMSTRKNVAPTKFHRA